MDLIIMGTGGFAVPTLGRLLDQGYTVRLLVTQPDRPQGRHQNPLPSATKQLALERGIPVFQPENVNAPEALAPIAKLSPDLFVVAAYGQILGNQLLQVPRLGGVNLHASLLPKYRGAAPVNWAIYHGETVTGVSVIHMTHRVDAGAILLQAETTIGPHETARELEARLAELGAPLVCQAIDGLSAGTLRGQEQDQSLATRAPKLQKEHGLIDWTRSADQVCNQIRAMQPWPMAFTYWHPPRVPGSVRLIIEQAEPLLHSPPYEGGARGGWAPADAPPHSPGMVSETAGDDLHVWASDAVVRIVRLRPAGKRSMSAAEFLRGNRVQAGERFSKEP